ncbi:4Fe-4S dicluster domain-containing protein [bacterium]|nr:4Fe-4S dicluster domain-containing protein [bacterium]
MSRKIIIMDVDNCIGCHSCAVVCKQENNVGLGTFWNKVITVGPFGTYPDLEQYFLPVLCQHCDNPKCVEACPTGASYKREDGIVLVDHEKCVGCRYCIMACPYGVRDYSEDKGVIEKCTMCAHLVDNDDVPACVFHCPGKARVFGDLEDPDSAPSRLVKKAGKDLHYLSDIGNKPGMGYVLKKFKWRE